MATERKISPVSVTEPAPRSFSQPPSPEEIARRSRVIDEMLRLRDQIGPIGMTTEELLAEEDEVDD